MQKKLHTFFLCLSLTILLSACGGGGGGSQTNQPPSITTQPSGLSIVAGNKTTLSVIASGTNLSYQWQVDSGSGFANVSDTGIYSGSTTATINLANVTSGMNGYKYRVVVNGAAAPAATSNIATLTVTGQAVISVSIAGLPQAGINTGVIAFTLKIPDIGVTPAGLNGNDAISSVSFGSTLSSGWSGVIYNSATHEINFGGLSSSGTTNGKLLDITCNITPGTSVNKSDFTITSYSVDDINTSYTATASLPIDVTFK